MKCEHVITHKVITKLAEPKIIGDSIEYRVLATETVCDTCKEVVGYFYLNEDPEFRSLG